MLGRKKLNDEQLVVAIRNGDQDAVVQLYKDNVMAIRNYILKNSGTSDDAEDILQEACVAVWEKIKKGELELKAKLSTFVFAISRNLWLKRLHKAGKQSQLDDKHTENLSVGDDTFASENRQIVVQMMDKLGTNCKDLLLMFYFEGYDMNTIAQKLQYNNADTAKAKKHQCFKQLQAFVLSSYDKGDLIGQ
ncbi:MAG: RNA polymerase sigma factor [bacterium]|nr:RNA polymerase sigma factor [bacterium]